jgi:hypothetical protein
MFQGVAIARWSSPGFWCLHKYRLPQQQCHVPAWPQSKQHSFPHQPRVLCDTISHDQHVGLVNHTKHPASRALPALTLSLVAVRPLRKRAYLSRAEAAPAGRGGGGLQFAYYANLQAV